MKADISRTTFRRNRHYSGVRLQQGRVQVDADFNEQVDIGVHRDRETTRDLVGPDGAPKAGGGFRVGLGVLLESIAFAGNRGVAVGPTGVLTTSDGVNWNPTTAGGDDSGLHGVTVLGNTEAWAVGDGGRIVALDPSTGTGTTTIAPVTQELRDVHAVAADRAWAVGRGGTIVFNQAGTWVQQAAPTGAVEDLHAVHFPTSARGWAVGDRGRIVTFESDAWTTQAPPQGFTAGLRGVFFSDASNGWAVGEGASILSTTDGGSTWTARSAPAGVTATLRGVAAAGGSVWAVGDDATVIRSADGGASWAAVAPPAGFDASLLALVARASDVIAAGDLSTIATIPADGDWTLHPAPATAADLTISPGHMYVGGVLCENERTVRLSAQPDLPGGADVFENAGANLVYVDVWQRHVTALDDPLLRESALGGPDHATRTKTVWQVKVAQPGDVPEGATCATLPAGWAPASAASSARLRAWAQPSQIQTDECMVPARGGYRRLENQLYRVEIHEGTQYKWSRDNGSTVARLESLDPADATAATGKLTVSDAGRDAHSGLRTARWVELSDERRALRGEAGILLEVDRVNDNEVAWRNYAGSPFTMADFGAGATVRRWDGTASAVAGGAELESGVWVELDGSGRPGDHWTIPARTLKGEVEWPTEGGAPRWQPREGVEHRYAPLAFVQRDDGGSWSSVVDCRDLFPPLTDITADDVSYDPRNCSDLAGVSTVQEALDGLCARPTGGTGTCTVSAFPGDDLQAAVEKLPITGGELCLAAGEYVLDKPLRITARSRVQVTGRGPATVIRARSGETAILVTRCEDLRISSLRAEAGGGSQAPGDDHLRGTITFRDCDDVSVVDCELTCEPAAGRARACLTFWGKDLQVGAGARRKEPPLPQGRIRIERNRFEVGAFQTGVLVLNPEEVAAVGNHVSMAGMPTDPVEPEPAPEDDVILRRERAMIEFQREELENAMRLMALGEEAAELPPGEQPTMIRQPREVERFAEDVGAEWTRNRGLAIGEALGFVTRDLRRRVETRGVELGEALTEHAAEAIRGEAPPPPPPEEGAAAAEPQLSDRERRLALARVARALRAVGQGIVVGGDGAGTIQILDNVIEDVIQGIHVGLSNADIRGQERASEAIVSRNVVHSLVPTTWRRERHAVFVGNVGSATITDTTATLKRTFDPLVLIGASRRELSRREPDRKRLAGTPVEAIRVWGAFGVYMVVRQSSLRGYSTGVTVRPMPDPGRQEVRNQLWLVAETMALGTATPVDAPASVEQDRNYGLPV